MCLLRQKHAFRCFYFFHRNGAAFKISHTDPDELKKKVSDGPKCLLRPKHALRDFNYFFSKKPATLILILF